MKNLAVIFLCFGLTCSAMAETCYEIFLGNGLRWLNSYGTDFEKHTSGLTILKEMNDSTHHFIPGGVSSGLDFVIPPLSPDSRSVDQGFIKRRLLGLKDLPEEPVETDFVLGETSPAEIERLALSMAWSIGPNKFAWKSESQCKFFSVLGLPAYAIHPLAGATCFASGTVYLIRARLTRLQVWLDKDSHHLDRASKFFLAIRANLLAHQRGKQGSLKPGEVVWLHGELPGESIDFGFSFLNDNVPRFVAVHRRATP